MESIFEELSPEGRRPPQPKTLPAMQPRRWVFALRFSGDEIDAEALVQEACARALADAHAWNPACMRSLACLRSRSISEPASLQRRLRARIRASIREMPPFEIEPGVPDIVAVESDRWIVQAVAQMPDPQRIAVLLRIVQCLPLSARSACMSRRRPGRR